MTLSTEITEKRLERGKYLKGGTFGDVYEGTLDGKTVALKILRLNVFSKDHEEELKKEAAIMHKLDHLSVIKFHGISRTQWGRCMVLEYLPKGSLRDVLKNGDKELLPWPVRWGIAIDVASGLSYLHQNEILHLDLKSDNVLLTKNYQGKICDFGLSKIKQSSNYYESGKGTTNWMSPELFNRKVKFTYACDIYAFGMVLWEIAARKIPFEDAINPSQVSAWVCKGDREPMPKGCPKEYYEVVKKCWSHEPSHRPTAPVACNMLQNAQPKSPAEPGEQEYKTAMAYLLKSQIKPAFAFLEKAAEKGYPPAYVQLACWDGRSYHKDPVYTEEVERLSKLMGGEIEEKTYEGWKVITRFGPGNKPHYWRRDWEQDVNIDWLKKRATASNPDICYQLAVCYLNGIGVSQDNNRGVQYANLAINHGHVMAHCALGAYFADGISPEADIAQEKIDRARALLNFSVDRGYVEAKYKLGLIDLSIGIKNRDIYLAKVALNMLEKASQQGSVFAPLFLMELFGGGGVSDNDFEQEFYKSIKDKKKSESYGKLIGERNCQDVLNVGVRALVELAAVCTIL